MERRRNLDLHLARDRDRRTRDQELKADARIMLAPHGTLFVQAVAVSEVRRQKATGTVTHAEGLQRGKLWGLFQDLGGQPLALQVGRMPLVDSRTSWWDEDLDALRVMAHGADWSAETGIGREWARKASFDHGIDLRNRGVWRWFGQARWTWSPRQTLEAFWLHANDRSGVPVPGSL